MRTKTGYVLLLCTLSADATTPLIDRTFGTDGVAGMVVGQTASTNYLTSAGVQSDGKVVLFGDNTTGADQSAYIVRLNSDGSADTSFGTNASGQTSLNAAFNLGATAFADDGSILFAGDDPSEVNSVVGRFTSSGALDATFHLSGYRELLPTAFGSIYTNSLFDGVFALNDGKVLAIGFAVTTTNVTSACGMAVQFNADGSLDQSFGNGSGTVCVGPPYSGPPIFEVTTGARLSSGDIILAGGADHTGGSNLDVAMTRLLASGEIDTSFGNDGWVTFGFDVGGAFEDYATTMTVDDQGRVLLGVIYTTDEGVQQAVMRYTSTGQLDDSFGTSGIVELPGDVAQNLAPYAMWMIPGGYFLIASISTSSAPILEMTEIDSDGKLVNTFGNGGTYEVPVPISFSIAGHPAPMGDYVYGFGQSSATGLSALRVVVPIFNNGFE